MTKSITKYLVGRKFVKSFKKFDIHKKKRITMQINLFLRDPYSPVLKTHKLTGKLKGFWAFSIEYKLRIMFRFVDDVTVELIDIGTHSIYK